MTHEILLDGETYISSKRAADITGYKQDYIGQLARSGKVDARRVSGLWYLKRDSLEMHKSKADAYVPIPPKKSARNAQDAESVVALDGHTYVSAQRASEVTGYHQDYIGQLARSGKIQSQQVGNRWYVHLANLKAHKVEKDALLAAVQTSSVGIARKVDDAIKKETQNLDKSDRELHFSYLAEDRELLPDLDNRFRRASAVEERAVGENDDIEKMPQSIPIRVTETNRQSRRVESGYHYAAPRRSEFGGKIKAAGIVTGVLGLIIVVFSINLNLFSFNLESLQASAGHLLQKELRYERGTANR